MEERGFTSTVVPETAEELVLTEDDEQLLQSLAGQPPEDQLDLLSTLAEVRAL